MSECSATMNENHSFFVFLFPPSLFFLFIFVFHFTQRPSSCDHLPLPPSRSVPSLCRVSLQLAHGKFQCVAAKSTVAPDVYHEDAGGSERAEQNGNAGFRLSILQIHNRCAGRKEHCFPGTLGPPSISAQIHLWEVGCSCDWAAGYRLAIKRITPWPFQGRCCLCVCSYIISVQTFGQGEMPPVFS